MSEIKITAADLCKLLGISEGQGIFDITMNAWDGACTFTVTVADNEKLVESGLR
jgi:hypothetical protein